MASVFENYRKVALSTFGLDPSYYIRWLYLELHKVAGVELKGDCLINSKNFALNFITALSFGADRSDITENHLNINENGSTSIQIDMGINEPPTDMVLMICALFNQLIEIDHLRKVNTVE